MTKVAQLCHVKPILKNDKIQQVCVESQPPALNRRYLHLLLSTVPDIDRQLLCGTRVQQQTATCHSCCWLIGQTARWMDGYPTITETLLHIPCRQNQQRKTYSVSLWAGWWCSANFSICRKFLNSCRILTVITGFITCWSWITKVLCNRLMTTTGQMNMLTPLTINFTEITQNRNNEQDQTLNII